MTLTAAAARWLYSGAASSSVVQSDPLLSLGGLRPDNVAFASSAPYRQEPTDATSPSLTKVTDTQTDTPASTDPAVGDWLTVINGAAARSYGRIIAVDYVGHVITLDRALSALTASGDILRTSRRQNVFPDATLAQVQAGVVDHRMLYFLKTDPGTENNFRFWIDPIIPNGCDIELAASGTNIPDNLTVDAGSLIASAEQSPFGSFGQVIATGNGFGGANAPRIVYSEAAAVPDGGSGAVTDEGGFAVWLRRTIPANASPGECVFMLNVYVPNAVAQDAGASPNPFRVGFLMAWNNPEPAYAARIFADRPLHTGGQARIFGEVTYPDGSPAVGLNARLSLVSGDGTLTADPDAFTDSLGRVRALYDAPATVGTDPTFRISVPASSRV